MQHRQALHTTSARRTLGVLLVFLLATPLTGCELLGLSDTPQTTQNANVNANKNQRKAPPVTPPTVAAEEEEDEEYERPSYPENRRRNPFRPDPEVFEPVIATPTEDPKNEPVNPTARFPLTGFELAAIISDVAVPKAMFIDPDGLGHILKEGDELGQQKAVITDIRDNEVDLREGGGTEDDGREREERVLTMQLREVNLQAEESDSLSAEEREVLEKLLQKAKPDADDKTRRENALGASASEGRQPPSRSGNDGIGGVAPPSRR